MVNKKKLTRQQVLHVAKLANLRLKKGEISKFQKQLSEVLDYISQLDELDTKKTESTSQVPGLENVFREDKPTSSLSRKEALSGAKKDHNGLFRVKAVFE